MTSLVTDGRIALRPLDVADTPAHLGGCDVLINERLGGGRPPREADVARWLQANAVAWAEAGDVVDLGIEDVATGALTGCVGLQRGLAYLRDGEVNLTYALYPAWRGRGYATAALVLAMDVARSRGPEVVRFVVRAAPDNAESLAVARRAGFSDAGQTDDEHGLLTWLEHHPP